MTVSIWPAFYGELSSVLDPPCRSCPDDPVPGTAYCHQHRGDDPDYEPTDVEIAQHGVRIEPTDPWDSPSYTTLNNHNLKEVTQ